MNVPMMEEAFLILNEANWWIIWAFTVYWRKLEWIWRKKTLAQLRYRMYRRKIINYFSTCKDHIDQSVQPKQAGIVLKKNVMMWIVKLLTFVIKIEFTMLIYFMI